MDVGVVDPGDERHFGRLEGVARREVNGQEEDPFLVRTICRARDGGFPVEEVVIHGTCGTFAPSEFFMDALKLLGDAIQRHCIYCCV